MTVAKHSTEEQALTEALTRLETQLITPQVPGELDTWVSAVRQAAIDLGPQLETYVLQILHKQYAEIAKADPELLPRVETLITEDQRILEQYQELVRHIDDLAELIPGALKDENRVIGPRTRVEQEGTQFILRIRKQLVAAATWLDEALFRDRGPVD